MQELLGRLNALDPEASLGLRVIACFDELMVGRVNTHALLAAAAALAGCPAGFSHDKPARCERVGIRGERWSGEPPSDALFVESNDGLRVWLERQGAPRANDAIILERLSLALRVRHGLARVHEERRWLSILLDPLVSVDERREAAGHLGLSATLRYRIAAAPLFATWEVHSACPEDVISTPWGPIHALVAPAEGASISASPMGVGVSAPLERLDHSFRTALVALRLARVPDEPVVRADTYGGLIELLADAPADATVGDVEGLDDVMAHGWGPASLDAITKSGSVREAARRAGVHHSTMQTRLEIVAAAVGFDPLEGLGRTRLGIAFLVWRLRHSRTLDLPAPAATPPAP